MTLLERACVCLKRASSRDSPAVLLEEDNKVLQEVGLVLSGDLVVGLCEEYLAQLDNDVWGCKYPRFAFSSLS